MAQTPEQISNKLKQIKGESSKQWGSLSDLELQKIKEKRAVLVGKMQKRYTNGKGQPPPTE